MNLWTFGGSYIKKERDKFLNQYNDQWIQIVAHETNSNLNCCCLGGSSIDWIYKKFIDNYNNIQENDIVIVTFTAIDRRWLFKDHPDQAYCRESPNNNIEENKALKYYTLYLDNPIPYEYYLLNFLHMLNLLTEKKNLHTILLTCSSDTENFLFNRIDDFKFLNIALGNLLNISFKEYDLDTRENLDILASEFLTNHMLASNHRILANKIISNIQHNTLIDLNIGFKENLINNNSFMDIDFCMRENFGQPLNLKLPHPFKGNFIRHN